MSRESSLNSAGNVVPGHEIVEMRSGVVERPPVGVLHVLLGRPPRLGVDVDEHLGPRAHELVPDLLALGLHVPQRHPLHPPHRLHEEQVLRRVLDLEECSGGRRLCN